MALAGVLPWLLRSRHVRDTRVFAQYVAGSPFRILEKKPANRLLGVHPRDAVELADRDSDLSSGRPAVIPCGPARLGPKARAPWIPRLPRNTDGDDKRNRW